MVVMTNRPTAAVNVQMRDFTSRFTPNERHTIANVLNEREFTEVLHIVTNEENADVFLFTVQQDGPMFVIGKGRGEYFLTLLRGGEVLGKARALTEVLEKLPRPNIEESEDE